jgi:hypothetical protein
VSVLTAMPYRGRDTYYLEMHIAFSSLLMAAMCIAYSDKFATFALNAGILVRTPVWAWALLWLSSAVVMGYGIHKGSWKLIEHGSLLTVALWVSVFLGSVTSHLLFPLSAAVSPAFIIFTMKVYVYRTRVGRYRRDHGRSHEPPNGCD